MCAICNFKLFKDTVPEINEDILIIADKGYKGIFDIHFNRNRLFFIIFSVIIDWTFVIFFELSSNILDLIIRVGFFFTKFLNRFLSFLRLRRQDIFPSLVLANTTLIFLLRAARFAIALRRLTLYRDSQKRRQRIFPSQ